MTLNVPKPTEEEKYIPNTDALLMQVPLRGAGLTERGAPTGQMSADRALKIRIEMNSGTEIVLTATEIGQKSEAVSAKTSHI